MTADTPKPSPNGDLVARSDAWLIVKRDLFYKPNAQGYTGIRDHAGRYTLAEASRHADPQEGVSYVHEDDAPEFTDTCFHDLKAAHLTTQRDEARAALAKAEAVNANLHKVCQGYEATIRGLMDIQTEEGAQ